MGEMHRPYSRLRRAQNTISILARNQVGRHSVHPGYYPRIFIAPKNAQNAETKRRSGAVPILLLVIPALTTSTYSSLNVLQESNPQPQLLKASVYHSATSAVMATRWRATTKRAITRVARVIAMAMMMAGNKEGNGKGGKGDGNGNYNGKQQRGQWQWQ